MEKYTKGFAALHWIHAVVLIFILTAATLTLPDLPEKASELAPFKGHMIFGFVATLLTFIRIYMLRKQPELPALNMGSFRESMVTWNHRLIYVMLVVVGVSGMATAKSANVGQVLIFGKDPSVYTGPGGITETLGSVHSVSTTLLMILIAMHVVGVLSYMLKSKSNILKRVWF
jgi:cytochrome b561